MPALWSICASVDRRPAPRATAHHPATNCTVKYPHRRTRQSSKCRNVVWPELTNLFALYGTDISTVPSDHRHSAEHAPTSTRPKSTHHGARAKQGTFLAYLYLLGAKLPCIRAAKVARLPPCSSIISCSLDRPLPLRMFSPHLHRWREYIRMGTCNEESKQVFIRSMLGQRLHTLDMMVAFTSEKESCSEVLLLASCSIRAHWAWTSCRTSSGPPSGDKTCAACASISLKSR
jgi:hypothetical protein